MTMNIACGTRSASP